MKADPVGVRDSVWIGSEEEAELITENAQTWRKIPYLKEMRPAFKNMGN